MQKDNLGNNSILEEAKQYFSRREYAKSRDAFMSLYNLGETSVSINIADTFVMQGDNENALKWYERAADKGANVDALVAISIIYNNDESSLVDKALSFSIMQELPQGTTPLREYYLSWFYVEGIAVKRNLDKALNYSTSAYEQKLFEALGQSATIRKKQKRYLLWLTLKLVFIIKGLVEIVRVFVLGKKSKYFPFMMFRR